MNYRFARSLRSRHFSDCQPGRNVVADALRPVHVWQKAGTESSRYTAFWLINKVVLGLFTMSNAVALDAIREPCRHLSDSRGR